MAEIDRLKEIVEKLRSEEGCAWDRVQTHSSLKPECIEEAAEVISGINIFEETNDPENLKEELGDLLFQVMFHAVIAEEEGLFTFDDVAKTVSDKMVRRHPHVFGGVTFESDEELHAAWEEIKKHEKEGKKWQTDYLRDAFREANELIEKAEKRKGFRGKLIMRRRQKNRKLDILKQTRDRSLMPRPAVFRNRKKYDRNMMKDISRKTQDTE